MLACERESVCVCTYMMVYDRERMCVSVYVRGSLCVCVCRGLIQIHYSPSLISSSASGHQSCMNLSKVAVIFSIFNYRIELI